MNRFAGFLFLVLVSGLLFGAGCASVRPASGSRMVERKMLTTGYCPCRECCDWHRNWRGIPVYDAGPLKGKRKAVGMTASGVKARHGTIAADTSLYPFGTVMYIEGYGYGRVEDRGGAIKGAHIDLYFDSHHEAEEWGRRNRRVKVWL